MLAITHLGILLTAQVACAFNAGKHVDGNTKLWQIQNGPNAPQQKPLALKKPTGNVAKATMGGSKDSSSSNYTSLLDALDIMQDHFFEVSFGTWPDAIDWTAAVLGTHISATLSSISSHLPNDPTINEIRDHENTINRYFTQLSTFYFGENAFSLRNQAYDDMLWVVLDWLEAIMFIKQHSSLYKPETSTSGSLGASSWYARQFAPQFSHRARVFYDLASKGWDETLCGGGMVWNPDLYPYKNAITNQLFIAASISMYLHFPGDDDDAPFASESVGIGSIPPAKARDEIYLHNAVKGYQWLKNSGMRNGQGLYVDGFHIGGWRPRNPGTRRCDVRNEMVYTYNQGVILTGLRGLWEATGEREYLDDGHHLIQSVIAATGWAGRDKPGHWRWAGLGRNGVLEEVCDWSGICSQNGQTFKGIFFHHFSVFCAPLTNENDEGRPWLRDNDVHARHQQKCQQYAGWINWNADAATLTKDSNGEFGEWWGREAYDAEIEEPSYDGTDYRNFVVPQDDVWQISEIREDVLDDTLERRQELRLRFLKEATPREKPVDERDINDRGRGRTVETQSGGLSVVRAAWKLAQSAKDGI